MEMSDQLHDPDLFNPGEIVPATFWTGGLVSSGESLGPMEKEENISALPGIEARFLC